MFFHCKNVSFYSYFRNYASIVLFYNFVFFSPTLVEVVILEVKIAKKKICLAHLVKKNMAAQSARFPILYTKKLTAFSFFSRFYSFCPICKNLVSIASATIRLTENNKFLMYFKF